MSDSEDDFASADEGEVESSKKSVDKAKPAPSASVAPVMEDKPKAQSKDISEKDQPQRKQGKKKGKEEKGVGGKSVANMEPKSVEKKEDINSQQAAKGKNKKGKQKGGKKVEPKRDNEKEGTSGATASTSVDESGDAKGQPKNDSVKADDKPEMSNEIVDNEPSIQTKTATESTDTVTSSTTDDISENKTVEEKGEDSKPQNLVEDIESPSNGNTKPSSKPSSSDCAADPASLIKSPSSQSIARPPADHTEQQENVLDKLASAGGEKKQSSGWGWGWGSSLMDVASTSVSTFTHQVGEGFNTVLETVESTLNVPSPEELVQQQEIGEDSVVEKQPDSKDGEPSIPPVQEKPVETETKLPSESDESSAGNQSDKPSTEKQSDDSGSWFSSWGVGNITKMVESTGKNLVTGGLDALETLGKKTFDAINERDPGLKKTRGFLHDRGDKPNLSALLRDAKEQGEARAQHEKESEEARKAHFGALFDDFQGLAHLEALEILSNQSEKKLNSLLTALPPDAIATVKPHLLKIKENFEMEEEADEDIEEHEFVKLVTDLMAGLNVGTLPDKLTKTQKKIRENLEELNLTEEDKEKPQPKEIHQVAIQSLAELTSKSMEQFHKSGELILLTQTHDGDHVVSSKNLHSLTKVLCSEVGILSTKFTECLINNKPAEEDESVSKAVNQFVTNIYLEASNSQSYIQDGFQLLLPVLQQAALEKSQADNS